MGRPFAVAAIARRRRALLLGPAALLLAASLGVADIPVPVSPAGGVAEPPAEIVDLSPTSVGGNNGGTPYLQTGDVPVTRSAWRPAAVATWCAGGPRGIDPATVVHHGPRVDKVIALTFDDGWGGNNLDRILRMLQNAHVNATFFPVGRAVRHDVSTWKKVAAAGFPIADHTFDHRTLTGLCYATQLEELQHWRSVIDQNLGVAPLAVMRPPGGNYDFATRAAATSAGEVAVVLWDVDTRDWSGVSWRTIAAAAIAGQNGSIVVMHTDRPNTARALPTIIRAYRKRGFRFVTIGQLLGIPGAVPFG